MYINPIERIKKIHIWIGNTLKSEEDYLKYFNQEDDISQFSKDIDIDEYDEDFIGIIPFFDKQLSVLNVLNNEVPIDKSEIPKALEICNNLNIKEVNAVFYLTDSAVSIPASKQNIYNDLHYIGVYNSEL